MTQSYDASREGGPGGPHGDLEEAELVRRLMLGDTSGFDAYYMRTAPALCCWATLCLRRAPSPSNVIDVEDLVQSTWLHALRRLGTYDPARCHLRTWLFSIAKHLVLSAVRSRYSESRRLASNTSSLLALIPEDVTTLSRRVANDEAVVEFLKAVTPLSEEDRRLVEFRLEFLPFADIGALLRITEDSARKRWQRLREELQLRYAGFSRMLDEGVAL